MNRVIAIISALLLIGLVANCSGSKQHHKTPLGDPSSYNAHFPDMDRNGDDSVSWEEFKTRFPESNSNVYKALDLNKDGAVDHDEWHMFKEAHGLKKH